MNRHLLEQIETVEISLVRRGAVPTARVAIAKADGETDKATAQQAIYRYAEEHRRGNESISEAIHRLARTGDRVFASLYEAWTRL